MSKIILIFLAISFSFVSLEPSSSCECPTSHEIPQKIKIDTNFMASDVVIDNVNYGKPISVGNLIFLTKYVNISSGTINLEYSFPTWFRLPTKSEFETILSSLGSKANSVLSNTSGFNFQSGSLYMTNDKVYPSNTNGAQMKLGCFMD